MDWNVFAKYFVHGFSFSLLSLVLGLVVSLVTVVLVTIGSLIGLIIGLGILMLAIGGLNCFLAGVIWGVHAKTSFWSLFFHGIVLFLALLVVNGILVAFPNFVFPSTATTVITFIIGAFAGGFVGKKVAESFEEEFRREEVSRALRAKWADAKL